MRGKARPGPGSWRWAGGKPWTNRTIQKDESMTSFEKSCLRCGRPVEGFLHNCRAIALVVDLELAHISEQEAHPLDRLTLEDKAQIYGKDIEAVQREAEALIEEDNAAYVNGPLTYRVELHNLSGLGFQGSVDCWSIAIEGHTDSDLHNVLDSINSYLMSPVFLNPNDTYLCRLVSLNDEGRKYVWKIKRLKYDKSWELSEF